MYFSKEEYKISVTIQSVQSFVKENPHQGAAHTVKQEACCTTREEKERGNNWHFFVPESLIEVSARRGRCCKNL